MIHIPILEDHIKEKYNSIDTLFKSSESFLGERLNETLTPELEAIIEEKSNMLIEAGLNENNLDELIKEGILGSVLGGLTGLAFGKSIGKAVAKVLGLKEGSMLYDMLTSRVFATAVGGVLGSRI